MVTNLTSMMVNRLKLFQKKNNGKLPERIVVYRSGVSLRWTHLFQGQIKVVREAEIPLIIGAFNAFSSDTPYRPKLTIIICGKRHHVRFYPTDNDSAGRDGNPLPSTVVDRGITAIHDFDFFLQCGRLIHDCESSC